MFIAQIVIASLKYHGIGIGAIAFLSVIVAVSIFGLIDFHG